MRLLKKIAFVFLLGVSPACTCGPKGGLVDYCYIKAESSSEIPRQYFHLYGHRLYADDVRMGIFETVDEAKATAEKVQCPFRL